MENLQGEINKEFEVLFKKYYERLVLFAEAYVADLPVAEDIVQDVFLSLLSKEDLLSDVKYSKSYFFSSVRNACLDYLRKLKVQEKKDDFLFEASFYSGDFEAYNKEEVIDKIENLINQLPEQRKNILRLSIYEGMKYSEISEETGLSVNTIKTHIKKAYQDLRNNLDSINEIIVFLVAVKANRR